MKMKNVMIPGAQQTLQNLLHPRDEGAKVLIADLDISWALKAEQVDLTSLVKDQTTQTFLC